MKSQSRAGYQGSAQIPAVKQDLHSEAELLRKRRVSTAPRFISRREDRAEPGSPLPSFPTSHCSEGTLFSLGCAVGKTNLSPQHRDGSAGNKIAMDTVRYCQR